VTAALADAGATSAAKPMAVKGSPPSYLFFLTLTLSVLENCPPLVAVTGT
jgi:hypothetical protein